MWLADRYSSHLHPTSSLWLFSFSLEFLWRAKVFNFGQVPYEVSFSIKGLCFWCCVWKLCISKDCENFLLEISVLALISGCISYFELILHMIWVKGSKIWCGGGHLGIKLSRHNMLQTLLPFRPALVCLLKQLTLNVRIYFWILLSVPLISVSLLLIPHCLAYFSCLISWNQIV